MDISYISQEDQLKQKDKPWLFTDQEKIDILYELVVFLAEEIKGRPVEISIKTKKGNLVIKEIVGDVTLR